MNNAEYHPDTLVIRWNTAYQQAHEWAHVEQHIRQTWAWQLRESWLGVPFFERVANLAAECEAAHMAKRDMQACGIWSDADAREAFFGLLSYGLSLLSERARKIILLSPRNSQTARV